MIKKIKEDVSYPLVTLALILLVTIVIVERAFLAMNIIKNQLRN